jgi:hypothetical protein
MASHLLGVLKPSVVFQVDRDPGCPPGVTSDRREKASRLGPLSNRSPGVVPVKSSSGHGCSKRINALEQGLSALEACGDNVLGTENIIGSNRQHPRSRTELIENDGPLRTTLRENETTLFENRPITSALDRINENDHFPFGLALDGVRFTHLVE